MAKNLPSVADLLVRRKQAVPRGVANATPLFASHATNAELWDTDGRRYIDFSGGIGVLATGHRHPKVLAAVRDQLEHYTHTAFQVMAYEPYIRLAERLNALAPFRGPAQTLLLTSGAEAVENAIKIARAATARPGIIAFSGAFHGRTQLAMSLTGKISPYKRSTMSSANDIFRIPFPIDHRGIRIEDTLRAIESLFYADIEPARVAAIIIEPVQGEGGFHVAPAELLRELRRICTVHGILLIADEVQCGFGRTGRMFAIEHSGVEPDLVTMAKSMAGGFPLSGVLGRSEIMDRLEPGALGSTYGGSPIGCAAGLAVLDVIQQENLLARADALGEHIRGRLADIGKRSDRIPIANVRGLGAMIGFDIVTDRHDRKPDGAAAKRVTSAALDNGLVVLGCGTFGETIRILVPLTSSDAILNEGMDALDRALTMGAA